jgi:NADH-quinone oxidoreductase subunit M
MDTPQVCIAGLLIVPTVAAAAAAALGPRQGPAIRWLSLAATFAALVLAVTLAVLFADRPALENAHAPGPARVPTFAPRFAIETVLLPIGTGAREAIEFYVGVDGLNIWLIVLIGFLMVSAVLVSWTAIGERLNEYYAWLLALETTMLGVFLAFDIVLFYVFFELTLIPLFFLIGIWGGPERRYAARKFFIYTLTGSLITLLGVLAVVLTCATDDNIRKLTFSIPELVTLVNERLAFLRQNPTAFQVELARWHNLQLWVFLALAAGFAIKVPLVPLHTWLPLAHVEAPTAGSVLLAGVLLKIGAYGFLRLCLPLAPDASATLGVPLIGTLAVIGIVYGAFCALAQDDIKKLVAYSSVSHLGFCMLGMFALNRAGISGSILQMVNHGLSTGALFLVVGMLYERYHTRQMRDYGGMAARLGLLACAMVYFCLTSIGLPGLNGFVGEVLVLLGIFDHEMAQGHWPALGVVGATGIVLGAWYLLTMLRRVFFGRVKEPETEGHGSVRDLNGRELAALLPIAGLCLLLGVYPQPVLDAAEPAVGVVADIVGRSQAANAAWARTTAATPQPDRQARAARDLP